MTVRTIRKRAHIKFYDDDLEIYKRLKIQAVKEDVALQDIAIKAFKFYLNAVESKDLKI